MSDRPLSDQLEMLRVQLETALPRPAVLLVSSARGDDGKDLVAAELAESMNDAGYSTLLVLGNDIERNVDGAQHPKSLAEVLEFGIARYLVRTSGSSSTLNVIQMPGDNVSQAVSREGVARFADTCRQTYAVTIVAAACLLASPFAMLAAIAADGVLLTVREGRRVCQQDRQLAQVLANEEKLRFLGVVAVASSILGHAQPIRAHAHTPRTNAANTRAGLLESTSS